MSRSLKLRISLFFSILFVCMLSIITFAEEPNKGIIIDNGVILRKEAKEGSDVVSTLKLGEYVNILDNEDDWYYVEVADGSTGWIINELLMPVEEKRDLIKKGLISGDNVNVRLKPELDAEVLKSLSKGIEVTIVDEDGDWLAIMLQQDLKGWIHKSYVSLKPNHSNGKITGNNVNLRSLPSTNSQILTRFPLGSIVTIVGYEDGWYSVVTGTSQEGWVHQDFVSVVLDNADNATAVSRSANRSAGLVKLEDFAKSLLGKPYKYASNGPNSFDCSGFTSYVFKNFGISLPRSSKDQANVGEKISKSDLRLGDLVFFDTVGKYDGVISHVGIYLSDGKFIHASSGSNAKKVVISEINEGYYKEKYVTARRIF